MVGAVLTLMQVSWAAPASSPVDGNTLSFDGAVPVFTPTTDVESVAPAYLDRDGFLDLAFAADSQVLIAANTGHPFTGWLTPIAVGDAADRVNQLLALDLDRDTKIDLMTFSGAETTGEIRLWRNPGAPFAAAWTEEGAVASSSAITYAAGAAGDLDGDGAADLIAAGSDGLLRLWRNPIPPGGAFTTDWGAPVEIVLPTNPPHAVALVDLNGDGRLDVLVATDDDLYIWQNPGDPFGGSWTTHVLLASQGNALLALFIADVDGDGRPDPVAGDAAGNLLIWPNPVAPGQPLGGAWPAASVVGQLGEPVLSLIGGDFDRDGRVDLAAGGGGPTQTVRAWRNQGLLAIPWETITLGTRSDRVLALAAVDVDTDGDQDLFSGSGAGDGAQVAWWPNTLIHGEASFPEAVAPIAERSADVQALVQGDLDRDGWIDLVSSDEPGEIVIWQNGGEPMDGVWASHVVSTAHAVMSLALGDLDKDGDLEIVSGHTTSPRILVWQNQGASLDGPWVSSQVGDPGAGVGALAVADLDLDGWPDLVNGSGVHHPWPTPDPDHKVTVWQNDGTPFDDPWPFVDTAIISYSVNAVAVGDLDLDGWPDVTIGTDHAEALGSANEPVPRAEWLDEFQVRVLRNPGAPFGGPWSVTTVGRDPATVTLGPEEEPSHYHGYWGAAVHDLKLSDLDHDGDLDIVTAEGIEADYQVKVWENDGSPFDGEPETFHWTWQPVAVWYDKPPSPPWMGGSALAVDVADFNLDGWPDVVPGIGRWLRMWFQNTGEPFGTTITGTRWLAHGISSNPVNLYEVVAGDYDRDGDPDVASGSDEIDGPELGLWPNGTGGVALLAQPTGSSPMEQGSTDDLLEIEVVHSGYADEDDVRITELRVRLTTADGAPLTSAEANALVETLWLYRDTHNGKWGIGDTPIITVADLALDSEGHQTLSFGDDDPLTVAPQGETVTFFAVVALDDGAMVETPNAFQLWFDADATVEEADSGIAVGVRDAIPVGSGLIQIVGAPTHIRIEDAPAGTGGEVGDVAVASGYALDLYAVGRDALGQFVADQAVTWTLTSLSGGVVPDDLVPSADDMWARLCGHELGTARVTVEHASLGSDSTGIITVGSGPAHMTLSAAPPEIVLGSVASTTLYASLQDAGGMPVVDGVPVTFTVASGSGLASLPATPYVATTSDGQAVAELVAGTQTGQVVVRTHTGDLLEAVTVTIEPGPVAGFEISHYSDYAYAGSSLYSGPRVKAQDAYGNIKHDYDGSVYFLSSDPQATLSVTVDSPYTFTLQDAGVHEFDGEGFILGTGGYEVITVTDGVFAAATDPIEVRPGMSLGRVELSLSHQVITAGLPVMSTVEAFDDYGNSRGDWSPWCHYTIDSEAGGQWAGNVYTTERDGVWHITVRGGYDPPRYDTAELTVIFDGHRIYLPLVMRAP